jgi:hypothetical protein
MSADARGADIVRKIVEAERMGGGFRLYLETAAKEISSIYRERDQLLAACARVCEDTDWCPVCEQNPSHSHRASCPLVKEQSP